MTKSEIVSPKSVEFFVKILEVNEAPEVFVPQKSLSMLEDSTLHLTNVLVSDADILDSLKGQVSIRILLTRGRLHFDSLSGMNEVHGNISNDGSSTLEFYGLLAHVNSVLGGMHYIPDSDWNGISQITVTVDDMGNVGIGGALDASATFQRGCDSRKRSP